MLRAIDEYYASRSEPVKSCFQFLREYILGLDPHITEALKYGMPFFCYNGKMCCYLWQHKKLKQPYIGFVEGKSLNHPELLQEARNRMKILLVDPYQDIDLVKLDGIFTQMLAIYRK